MNYNDKEDKFKKEDKSKKEENCVKERSSNYQSGKKLYTLEDYYALPDDQRAELIDGVFHFMEAPSIKHQTFCMKIMNKIYNYIEEQKGTCKVLPSPVDVQLDCDDKTMVEPDIVVICDDSKITNRCIIGAPDFVVEVLSQSTMKKDMILKLKKYQNAGVREYWLVDAKKERVITYFFEEDLASTIYGMDEKVPVKIFGGKLKIDFGEISEHLQSYGQLGEE